MVLAADYPLLNAFWTMMIFFLWVLWFWLLITVFIDMFRRDDMSGWMKALWFVFVIVLPYIGVLVYLIAYGRSMAERRNREVQAAQAQFDDRIRTVAASNGAGGAGSAASEIEKANQLLASGTITQAEFDQIKQKALA
jgi:putative oligomerization/nucleic acid binding protein/phospholipase D-like protein